MVKLLKQVRQLHVRLVETELGVLDEQTEVHVLLDIIEIELQLLQLKHEHVKHVKHDIIVDDELRRMNVRMVHIDELLDEKR